MPSKILTLHQKPRGSSKISKHVETIARFRRFRALGEACRAQGISSLLFGHHADDQAETTFVRLANNYLGKGLAAMQWETRIPECKGLYGLHDSGSPRRLRPEHSLSIAEAHPASMLVEGGGIAIFRPLLRYTKDRLIATCKEAGVRWVEDLTNKDPSLTLRNAIRLLHETNALPAALRRPSLYAIAQRNSDLASQREAKAQEIFRLFDIKIDTRSGHAICSIPYKTAKEVNDLPDRDHVKATLLRKLLKLVVLADRMDVASLEKATLKFLPPDLGQTSKIAPITLASATAVRLESSENTITYELRRTPPPKNQAAERSVLEINMPLRSRQEDTEGVSWTEWHLWDERYWMRVGGRPTEIAQNKIVVRTLTPEDIADMRREPGQAGFDEQLTSIKGHLRTTLPALIQLSSEKDGSPTERIVALPSLGWSRDAWTSSDMLKDDENAKYFYDIRYLKVDESLTQPLEPGSTM